MDCQAASALKRQGDKPTGVKRHLEGWQLALVSLSMAGCALLLGIPRPAMPSELPTPTLDYGALTDMLRDQAQRAERVRSSPLPFNVRAVGEAFRTYGLALATSQDPMTAEAELRHRAVLALERHGPEALLDLRAIQTELFLAALLRWEGGDEVDDELNELGGNFVRKSANSGWLDATGRLTLNRSERSIMFRIRWGTLTALGHNHPFRPSLDEWRGYYAFLLGHPESRPRTGHDHAQQRLSYVNSLAKFDGDYPSDFARGVLMYQMGRFQQAAGAFQQHLSRRPDGPWTLRARNYWLGAAVLSPADP